MNTRSTSLHAVTTGNEPKNPVVVFSNFLDKLKPQLALALPKHLTADRMARLALSEFSKNDKLQACDPKSIAASIMAAGTMGLEIAVDGQGFLVPYGRTCTFVPGWKGLVDLVNRSGNATVYTGVIFADQKYRFTDGSRRELEVLNETDLEAPDDITHAYAVGWVKGASIPVIELWRVSKVAKHRDKYNKQGTKHYSYRDWEMYARKVVLLQVLKYMPKSIELQRALAANDAAEAGMPYTIEGDFISVDTSGATDGEQVDQSTGEISKAAADTQAPPPGKVPTCAEVMDSIIKAKTLDEADLAASLIAHVGGGKVQQTELRDAYAAKRTELGGDA